MYKSDVEKMIEEMNKCEHGINFVEINRHKRTVEGVVNDFLWNRVVNDFLWNWVVNDIL